MNIHKFESFPRTDAFLKLKGLYKPRKRHILIQPNYNSNLIRYKHAKNNCFMDRCMHSTIHTKWQNIYVQQTSHTTDLQAKYCLCFF